MSIEIERIVDVQITRDTTQVTAQGFGVPLILGPNAVFPERVRFYTTLDGVAEDFGISDPEFIAATAALSQNPSPERIAIGRRSADVAQTEVVTVETGVMGNTYTVTINGRAFSIVAADAVAANIAAQLVAAINIGAEPVTAVDNADGTLDVASNTPGLGFTIAVTGTVPADISVATAAENEDVRTSILAVLDESTEWYALALISNTDKDILDAASLVETMRRIFVALSSDAAHLNTTNVQVDEVTVDTVANTRVYSVRINSTTFTYTSDGDATDEEIRDGLVAAINGGAEPVTAAPDAGDPAVFTLTADDADVPFVCYVDPNLSVVNVANVPVGTQLDALDYARTGWLYHQTPGQFFNVALLGRMLPTNPGSVTWDFKNLAGIVPTPFTETKLLAVEGHNGGVYYSVGGVNQSHNIRVANAEYMDIVRGSDWLEARMEERIFGRLVNLDKIPYTDAGIGVIEAEVRAQLTEGVGVGFIAEDPAFTVSVPLARNVNTADKLARVLNGITFTATLAGAIHKTTIRGTLVV